MIEALTNVQRRLLAEKAAGLEDNEGLSVECFLGFPDWELRMFADDLSEDEWAERERNSDWIEEMEEAQNEADRKAGVIRPQTPFDISLLRFAAKDTRTATERALGLPGRDVLAEAKAALNGAGASNDVTELPNWISLAEQIAREVHADQFRKDGITPYITHPAEVAANVSDDLKPIAWLHDVIEDTNLALAHLQAAGLPPYVLIAVHALTKVEGEDYTIYLERVRANEHARMVKIADIENNLKGQPSEKARAKYLRALPVLRGLNDAFPQ